MSAVVILALLLIIGGLLCQIPGMRANETCDGPCCIDPEATRWHDPRPDSWEYCLCPACFTARGDRAERAEREAIAAEIDAALLDGIRPKPEAEACPCPECSEARGTTA